jgi:hypothetical protein
MYLYKALIRIQQVKLKFVPVAKIPIRHGMPKIETVQINDSPLIAGHQ